MKVSLFQNSNFEISLVRTEICCRWKINNAVMKKSKCSNNNAKGAHKSIMGDSLTPPLRAQFSKPTYLPDVSGWDELNVNLFCHKIGVVAARKFSKFKFFA